MHSTRARKPYPSDVSDEEWSLVVPYLTLMIEAAPQRDYPMRELFRRPVREWLEATRSVVIR